MNNKMHDLQKNRQEYHLNHIRFPIRKLNYIDTRVLPLRLKYLVHVFISVL